MKTEIPNQLDNPSGLHGRYFIQKVKTYEGEYGDRYSKLVPVDNNAEYFVMRLDEGGSDIEHIKACRIGVHAYADAIQGYLPDLAKDLKERYPLI